MVECGRYRILPSCPFASVIALAPLRAMPLSRVRAIVTIMVIGIFMLITGVLALWPVFTKQHLVLEAYADFFTKTASVYTGMVGVIIGYYFGRSVEDAPRGSGAEGTGGPDGDT